MFVKLFICHLTVYSYLRLTVVIYRTKKAVVVTMTTIAIQLS